MQVTRVDDQDQSFGNIQFNEPNECPICHRAVTSRPWQAFQKGNQISIVLRCPSQSCKAVFISYYEGIGNNPVFINSKPNTINPRKFSVELESISPKFGEIYNQAHSAEIQHLNHIAGPGYRKAFEFLIKDYAIKINPADSEIIKKEFLKKVIDDRISNVNIKTAAKRATWLGNDESHYVRIWNDIDMGSLKKMIEIAISWIELEIHTEQALQQMPDPTDPAQK